jgi:hypothetical protein
MDPFVSALVQMSPRWLEFAYWQDTLRRQGWPPW